MKPAEGEKKMGSDSAMIPTALASEGTTGRVRSTLPVREERMKAVGLVELFPGIQRTWSEGPTNGVPTLITVMVEIVQLNRGEVQRTPCFPTLEMEEEKYV